VLRTAQNDAWPELPALLAAAERLGVLACAASVGWEFIVTSQFIRADREIASGAAMHAPDARSGASRYRGSVPAAASPSNYRRQVNVA
jgi:hypothetical protein